jgi:hypothetical protein
MNKRIERNGEATNRWLIIALIFNLAALALMLMLD